MSSRFRMREKLGVLAFASVVVVVLAGTAFAAGYILGKILL